jgi:hypothetical protein
MFGRDGHNPEVNDLHDFLVHHVHVGHQSVHGVRPGAVLREVLHESQAAKDAAPLLLRVLEYAGGQRSHADLGDVQLAGSKGVQPALVRGQQRLHHFELLLENGKFTGHRSIEHDGGFHLLVRQGDDDVAWRSPRDVVDKDPEAPVLRLVGAAFVSRPAAPDRIQQPEIRDAVLRAKEALRLEDGPDLEDLRGRSEAEC